jgi:hypothetical protein
MNAMHTYEMRSKTPRELFTRYLAFQEQYEFVRMRSTRFSKIQTMPEIKLVQLMCM